MIFNQTLTTLFQAAQASQENQMNYLILLWIVGGACCLASVLFIAYAAWWVISTIKHNITMQKMMTMQGTLKIEKDQSEIDSERHAREVSAQNHSMEMAKMKASFEDMINTQRDQLVGIISDNKRDREILTKTIDEVNKNVRLTRELQTNPGNVDKGLTLALREFQESTEAKLKIIEERVQAVSGNSSQDLIKQLDLINAGLVKIGRVDDIRSLIIEQSNKSIAAASREDIYKVRSDLVDVINSRVPDSLFRLIVEIRRAVEMVHTKVPSPVESTSGASSLSLSDRLGKSHDRIPTNDIVIPSSVIDTHQDVKRVDVPKVEVKEVTKKENVKPESVKIESVKPESKDISNHDKVDVQSKGEDTRLDMLAEALDKISQDTRVEQPVQAESHIESFNFNDDEPPVLVEERPKTDEALKPQPVQMDGDMASIIANLRANKQPTNEGRSADSVF